MPATAAGRYKDSSPASGVWSPADQRGLEVTDKLTELPSGAFGLITLHAVFEHLANPTEVLDEIRRFLAPDGRLYIEVPNVRALRARLAIPLLSRRFGVDERYRAYPIHLMYYSECTLRKMLEKAGWVVEKSFTLGLGMDEFFTSSSRVLRLLTSRPISRADRVAMYHQASGDCDIIYGMSSLVLALVRIWQ
ncbi:MAG: class I SAM-dependent methyltransferase [Fuerstiella sp.]|nr:class I SAM-dependent methyltransferase [Fuerstiella sp.]